MVDVAYKSEVLRWAQRGPGVLGLALVTVGTVDYSSNVFRTGEIG